ncbi:MAG: Ig-like domain-containing protein [Saprospiraceae bacterium]
MHKIKFLLVALTLMYSCVSFAQPFAGKIGVGLDGIGGIALEFPNVTLTATAWQSVATGNNARTDAAGWPLEDFRVVFFDHRPTNAWNNAPDDPQKYVVDQSGTYTLSFTGQSNLSSWSDAPIQFLNKTYNAVTNTTNVDLVFPPGGGPNVNTLGNYGFLMVNFLQTNHSTGVAGVKNIRLMRPGYPHHSPQIFRTAYLNALSPFSTLRFMDFLKTNNSDRNYPNMQTWTQRQSLNAPRYVQGAPWEVIIALANYTAKDIWINIPVDADSIYVVELARLMKNTLRPELNIYLEYSNEVWNGSFTQYQYNFNAVLQSSEDADIRASTPWDDRRRARRVAKQVIKFGKIFENVMGVTVASRTKIRPVFAWQVGGWLPWYEDVLNWINQSYGPPKNFIYGIASAPYFNEGSAAANASPQQIINAMNANSDGNLAAIQTLAQFADQWKIKHLQYEGGPDNGGGSTVNVGNRILANRLPEMKTAVLHNYRDNWFSARANGTAPVGTNDLVNYFVMSAGVSRYGCWGATEDLDHIKNLSKPPKYDALCVLSGMCGNEPETSLLTPVNNARVPANIPVGISATATDPDGSIRKVEFFVGSVLIGVDSTFPYSVNWIPTDLGFHAVFAKSIDNDGKFTFDDPHVIEVVPNTTAVENHESPLQISLFPNPIQDELKLSFSAIPISGGRIELRDALGKLWKSLAIKEQHMQLDLSELANGIYFVTVILNHQKLTKKIIKSKN